MKYKTTLVDLHFFTNFENMQMPSQHKVSFFYEHRGFSLKHRALLKEFIATIFKREQKALQTLNYVFTTDAALLKINRDFLKHDFYTDIISFDLSNTMASQGEVHISIDRVRDNAKTHKTSFIEELHRVIFHGALHLCGYSDKSKSAQKLMRERENHYLRLYFQRST